MGFSDKGLHHIEGQNAVLGDFLVVSAMLFWAGQLTFEEKFIKKHNISPVHALGIEGKVIIKKSCREPFLWKKNTRFGLILGRLVVHNEKENWADYEQLLRANFSCLHGQKKKYIFF